MAGFTILSYKLRMRVYNFLLAKITGWVIIFCWVFVDVEVEVSNHDKFIAW